MKAFIVYNNNQKTLDILKKIQHQFDIEEDIDKANTGDLVLVLGGDGFMLRVLHKYINRGFIFYGVNTGNVGFLLNQHDNNLPERVANAEITSLKLLNLETTDINNNIHKMIAINEVSLFRQTNQSAKLEVTINQRLMLPEISGDGLIVATPAGSSAYNFSSGGPIIPINANLIALTGINSYFPRRWKSALIPIESVIDIEVIEEEKRPVNISADFNEVKSIKKARISIHPSLTISLSFDKNHNLEDRLIKEQFI